MTERARPDGWDRHRREQLEANLTTTPAQRLAWLEEAIRFAWKVGALPQREVRSEEERPELS